MACIDFGLASISETSHADAEARVAIDSEAIKAGRRLYTESDLKSDLNLLIGKFIPKDGLGVKTVEEMGLVRGAIGNSAHRDLVIEVFKRLVIERHELAGNRFGYHVRESAKQAVSHFSTNGVYTGPLAEAFDELKARVVKGS